MDGLPFALAVALAMCGLAAATCGLDWETRGLPALLSWACIAFGDWFWFWTWP